MFAIPYERIGFHNSGAFNKVFDMASGRKYHIL